MSYFLGVDIGTSFMKATVIDEDAKIRAQIRERNKVLFPKPGFAEFDPSVLWKTFVEICSKLKNYIDLDKVESVCISSICASFVPVDVNLNPLCNIILYGIDRRAVDEIEYLNRLFLNDELTEVIGGHFTTQSIIPKILWLRNKSPSVYEKTRFIIKCGNFVTSRLTGEVAWDYPTAAGAGLLDLEKNIWAKRMLDPIKIDFKIFPPLKWPYEVLGEVTRSASNITGLKKGTKVLVGACDINMESIASGAIHIGDLLIVYGSTISILLNLGTLIRSREFFSGPSIKPGIYKLGGATSAGGALLYWFKKITMNEDIESSLGKVPAGSNGLVILPYFEGARTPIHDPDAKGIMFGLNTKHRSCEIYNALLESIGYEIRHNLEKLQDYASLPHLLYSTGGASKSFHLLQIVSDITDMIQISIPNIDASYGDAILALSSGGIPLEEIYSKGEIWSVSRKLYFYPRKNRKVIYDRFYKLFLSLYEKNKSLFTFDLSN